MSTAARRHLVQSIVQYNTNSYSIKIKLHLKTQKAAEGGTLRDILWNTRTGTHITIVPCLFSCANITAELASA